jgi:hypothetical protein
MKGPQPLFRSGRRSLRAGNAIDMSADLVMPKLGLNMTEGQLASWLVAPGDSVARGDVLFTVETDKIATEIEAVDDGRILSIIVPAGETVPVGTPVARWTGGVLSEPAMAVEVAVPVAEETAPEPAEKPVRQSARSGARIVATPYARKRAAELGIDLATVDGSGPRGRVKADDVEKAGEREPVVPALEPIEIPGTASPMLLNDDPYRFEINVDASPSLALLEKLAPDGAIGIAAIVVAATGCAYPRPVVFIENGAFKLFPISHSLRLGDIVSDIDSEARSPVEGDGAGAITMSRSAKRFSPSPVMYATFTLGVGQIAKTRDEFVGRCDITLTLTARPSAMVLEDAETLLERIGKIVETPALLLLGRVS